MNYTVREMVEISGMANIRSLLPRDAIYLWERKYADKYGEIPSGLVSDNFDEIEDEIEKDGGVEEITTLRCVKFDERLAVYKDEDGKNISLCKWHLRKLFSKVPKYIYFKPTIAMETDEP